MAPPRPVLLLILSLAFQLWGCGGVEALDAATEDVDAGAPDLGPSRTVPTVPAEPVRVARTGSAPTSPSEEAALIDAVRERAAAARSAFERQYPNHGVTAHFLARVRSAPNVSAPVAGYMRRGSRFRATERVPGVGCRRGWFEVPGGGYVCRGEAFRIDGAPPEYENAPIPPALEDSLPYDYALTRAANVPQFWHLPSESEESQAADLMAAFARSGPLRSGSAGEEVAAPTAPGTDGVNLQPTVDLTLPAFLRQRMLPGFYVSLDGAEQQDGRRYARTVRGGFVRESALRFPEPSTRRGVVLGGSWRLPVAFTLRDGTHRLRRIGTTRRFASAGTLDRQTAVHVAETMERNGSRYVVDRDGFTIRRAALRVAERVARPRQVREGSRWLHISLREQTLVAYEGDSAVFATTVSSGREGFDTPLGLFRIQSKHVSTTMDDLTDEEHAYQIEDVPWTMYFEGNYAIHTAFWHDSFGRRRSHGCLNLAPADARWVFHWAGPELPDSWHGVFADRERAGTWVYITE